MSTFEEILQQDGKLIYKTKGVSMKPMLTEDRDLVVIRIPSSRLRKYDVALYKRGTDYVLHRVIKARETDYQIRGDNTYRLETVPFDAVIGVLTEFNRKGKLHSVQDPAYKLYARFWCAVYPVRYLIVRCRSAMVNLLRRIGLLPILKRWLKHE